MFPRTVRFKQNPRSISNIAQGSGSVNNVTHIYQGGNKRSILFPVLLSPRLFISFVLLLLLCTLALVFVMGKEGVHGGQLNKKAFHMAEYLRKSGY